MLDADRVLQLQRLAASLRARVIEVSAETRTPHLGSSLSCIDILVAYYFHYLRIDSKNPHDDNRDRFILSKGHAASALYAVLSRAGFFEDQMLNHHGKAGSPLEEHPNPHSVLGVDAATGSLGHGLPIACGLALAAQIEQRDYRVAVLMSDGECNEGSVWEAALFAAGKSLNQLTVIVDYNRWQATGRSDEVLGLNPLMEKWQAFGWDAVDIDGHDLAALTKWLDQSGERPRIAIAHTIKGKGVSFMEDDNNWHYRIPTEQEVRLAQEELLMGEAE